MGMPSRRLNKCLFAEFIQALEDPRLRTAELRTLIEEEKRRAYSWREEEIRIERDLKERKLQEPEERAWLVLGNVNSALTFHRDILTRLGFAVNQRWVFAPREDEEPLTNTVVRNKRKRCERRRGEASSGLL